jgi:uncharacterized RmlC-like cupin family protein
MQTWKDIKLDDKTMWPVSHVVDLDPAHADMRGAIQSLVNLPMKNASLITSYKGAIRSNHYHRTDWHFMYTISGSYDYYYRPTDSGQPLEKIHVGPGQMIFTPPMEDHATVFCEDTVLLVMSRNPRDQEAYESDVVRIALVDDHGKVLV